MGYTRRLSPKATFFLDFKFPKQCLVNIYLTLNERDFSGFKFRFLKFKKKMQILKI